MEFGDIAFCVLWREKNRSMLGKLLGARREPTAISNLIITGPELNLGTSVGGKHSRHRANSAHLFSE